MTAPLLDLYVDINISQKIQFFLFFSSLDSFHFMSKKGERLHHPRGAGEDRTTQEEKTAPHKEEGDALLFCFTIFFFAFLLFFFYLSPFLYLSLFTFLHFLTLYLSHFYLFYFLTF